MCVQIYSVITIKIDEKSTKLKTTLSRIAIRIKLEEITNVIQIMGEWRRQEERKCYDSTIICREWRMRREENERTIIM